MAKILILGAGAMGSAFSVPLLERMAFAEEILKRVS